MKKSLILILTILSLLLPSCNQSDIPEAFSDALETMEPVEQRTEKVFDESEIYYENTFIFRKLSSDRGYDIINYGYRVAGDEIHFNNYDSKSNNSLIVDTYDIEGNNLRSQQFPDEIVTNYFHPINNDEYLYYYAPDAFTMKFIHCDKDGNTIAESKSYPRYFQKYSPEVPSFETFGDLHIFHMDYNIYLFHDVTEKATIYELPCLIRHISQLPDGRFLLYGKIDNSPFSNYEYFWLDPETGESGVYQIDASTDDARTLFPGRAREVYYQRGELYGICEDGFYVLRDGDFLKLIDWNESNLDGRSIEFREIFSDTNFLVEYYNYMEFAHELGFLVLTEEPRTKPREVFTVATIGLDTWYQHLVDNAVLQFNRESQDYKIEYHNYHAHEDSYLSPATSTRYTNEEAAAAAQKRFEEDLLSGIVYDCYIFSEASKNRDLLAGKGLLADLSPYLGEDQVMGCVETAYMDTEEQIVALPFFMKLTTLVTSQSVLSSKKKLTYDVMYDIAASLADNETLFTQDVYNGLKTTGQYEFLDLALQTCSFDSEACVDWLEFLTDVKDGTYRNTELSAIFSSIDEAFATPEGSVVAREPQYAAPTMDSYKNIENGSIKFTQFRFDSVESILALLWCYQGDRINYCGYPSAEDTTVILSANAVFSMSTVTAAGDGVNAFLQYLLSDEIQTCQAVSTYGIPVTRSALTQIFPVGYVHYRYTTPRPADETWLLEYPDGTRFINQIVDSEMRTLENQLLNNIFDVVRVTTDDRDLFLRFLDRAVVHTAADTTLQSILDEEISYVTGDARSAADAAKILQSRVGIYLAE